MYYSTQSNRYRNLIFLFSFLVTLTFSQSYFFGEGPVKWETRKPYEIPPEALQYETSDLVILDDHMEIDFYSSTNEKITRNIKYKVNSKKGLENLRTYEMPESFDLAYDKELHQQGSASKIKTPNVRDFKLKVFAARKFSRQRWANVTVKDRYQPQRWIKSGGEHLDVDALVFDLGTIAVGDIVEIYYECYFNVQYGTNIFYFQGPFPKIKTELELVYRWNRDVKDASFIVPVNIDSSGIYTSKVAYETYFLVTTKFQILDLKADLYPLNRPSSEHSPYVYLDLNYYRSLVTYSDKQYLFSKNIKPRSYEWKITIDTNLKAEPKVFDKQYSAIKKFTTLALTGSDSGNLVFIKALNDTLNNFRFITANHLFYNESNIYEMYSGEHLLKRRLPEHKAGNLYLEILKDAKVFYYQVNIQDKRLGEHDLFRRIHFAYERNLIALPLNDSLVYFVPRTAGLKYHANELPFYYEDVVSALIPMNSGYAKNKSSCTLKFIKTNKSTFKENIRSQESAIKIKVDSLVLHISTVEKLSGQFSTILRPVYLKEALDSTVSSYYFKRCVDVPSATLKKVELKSRQSEAPYTYVFNCKTDAGIKDPAAISLKGYFSFLLSAKVFPLLPTGDYRFDFEWTDLYVFQLEFNAPCTIKNKDDFNRKIDNSYFQLQSSIERVSDTKFVLKVKILTKQQVLPKDKSGLLKEIIGELEQLENFTLQVAKAERN